MALSLPATILLKLFAQLRPDGDEGGGSITEVNYDRRLNNGTGDAQANQTVIDRRTLGAGSTETIDWTTFTDGNGNALNAVEVVFWGIEADVANGAGIQCDDSTANPWTSFFRSSGATDNGEIEILPGGIVFAGTTADPAYPVAAGNRDFLVTNLDGANAATYTIFAVTRSA